MSLDHLRQFHTYVNYDAQAHAHILPSNSQVSVRRITAITEKHTDNENVLTRAQRIKQTIIIIIINGHRLFRFARTHTGTQARSPQAAAQKSRTP